MSALIRARSAACEAARALSLTSRKVSGDIPRLFSELRITAGQGIAPGQAAPPARAAVKNAMPPS